MWVGAALTKPGRASTARWRRSGERGGEVVAERYTRGTGVYAPQGQTGSNLMDLGQTRRAPWIVRAGGVRGNSRRAFLRWWEAMVKRYGVAMARSQGSSRVPTSPSDRRVNTGTVPGLPRSCTASVGHRGWAHRLPNGSGRGGATVVLRR